MVAVVDKTVLMTTGVVVVVRVLIAVLVAGFVTVRARWCCLTCPIWTLSMVGNARLAIVVVMPLVGAAIAVVVVTTVPGFVLESMESTKTAKHDK